MLSVCVWGWSLCPSSGWGSKENHADMWRSKPDSLRWLQLFCLSLFLTHTLINLFLCYSRKRTLQVKGGWIMDAHPVTRRICKFVGVWQAIKCVRVRLCVSVWGRVCVGRSYASVSHLSSLDISLHARGTQADLLQSIMNRAGIQSHTVGRYYNNTVRSSTLLLVQTLWTSISFCFLPHFSLIFTKNTQKR